jgi:hypothetical protein
MLNICPEHSTRLCSVVLRWWWHGGCRRRRRRLQYCYSLNTVWMGGSRAPGRLSIPSTLVIMSIGMDNNDHVFWSLLCPGLLGLTEVCRRTLPTVVVSGSQVVSSILSAGFGHLQDSFSRSSRAFSRADSCQPRPSLWVFSHPKVIIDIITYGLLLCIAGPRFLYAPSGG